MSRANTAALRLSVIVPVLNEADRLQGIISSLGTRSDIDELVIVDSSRDQASEKIYTYQIVDSLQVLANRLLLIGAICSGRASQMNLGAEHASGNLLLFLHADTLLPEEDLRRSLGDVVNADGWGRFDVRMQPSHWWAAMIAAMMNRRSRWSGIATGDQGIFVSRALWQRAGGFSELPIMEDIDLSKRLIRISRPHCLRQRVVTSARRWQQCGVARTIGLMWMLRFLYWLGVPAVRLSRIYRNVR